ncbi:hypothetical protein MMC13_002690 [Lambiella insularis]|nr:hypothetical protein [Lambiella insularis]
MAATFLRFGAAIALAIPAFASPTPRNLRSRQQCEGQSCTIAALSGSSGQVYDPTTAPTGGSDVGDCCIITYNPSAAAVLYAEKPGLQATCTATTTKHKRELSFEDVQDLERRACSPYTLIYARGTDEIGTLGETVGPALAIGLEVAAPGKWSIQGVNYQATSAGDDCLGLPGGQIAAQQLESVASSCPNTKIIMAGYSEGAMVAHNGVAYATATAASRVTGVVVFGDPFNGAPIRNYKGPIKTYCATGDEVCDGEYVISAAHLSYVGLDTTEAVFYISGLVMA